MLHRQPVRTAEALEDDLTNEMLAVLKRCILSVKKIGYSGEEFESCSTDRQGTSVPLHRRIY
jgi:hypothetical protein